MPKDKDNDGINTESRNNHLIGSLLKALPTFSFPQKQLLYEQLLNSGFIPQSVGGIEEIIIRSLQTEKSWNQICDEIPQPVSRIALILAELSRQGRIKTTRKNGNIFYEQRKIQQADYQNQSQAC